MCASKSPSLHCLLVALALAFCAASGSPAPPLSAGQIEAVWDRQVDPNATYVPYLSPLRWVVPSDGLPEKIRSMIMPSNNCVGIKLFNGTLFMGWRSAPSHFASTETIIVIASSQDLGLTWQYETHIKMGSDVREPYFITVGGQLIFSFFQAGTDPFAFEPKHLFRIFRKGFQQWTDPEVWGHEGEIAWQLEDVGNMAYASSYSGDHYAPSNPNIKVYFNYTRDGRNWYPVNQTVPWMYFGGVSEVGWTFDAQGNFWAVLRNEDGDSTGFGSHIAFSPANNLGTWEITPKHSDPNIYESPRMFRHGDDLYLVARRDVNGPFDLGYTELPFDVQKYLNLAEYSLRAHTTALWRLDPATRKLEWIMDLPGDGDNAFPSIVRLGPHRYLIANYTSPLKYPGWSWIEGQTSSEGTQIYFIVIEFMPAS